MKNILSFAILSLIIILSSCEDTDGDANQGSNNPNTDKPANNEVIIMGSSFEPRTITVAAGTTVKWTNSDSMSHTVTSNNGLFNSGNINSMGTYSFTFPSPGTYTYYCEIHPSMTGTVVVQ